MQGPRAGFPDKLGNPGFLLHAKSLFVMKRYFFLQLCGILYEIIIQE